MLYHSEQVSHYLRTLPAIRLSLSYPHYLCSILSITLYYTISPNILCTLPYMILHTALYDTALYYSISCTLSYALHYALQYQLHYSPSTLSTTTCTLHICDYTLSTTTCTLSHIQNTAICKVLLQLCKITPHTHIYTTILK